MAKRPKLAHHLRLADTPPLDREPGTTPRPDRQHASTPEAGPEGAGAERAEPRPPADGSELLAILTDATAEMTRLTFLGWSKAWEVQLRLTRFWLGRDDLY